MIKTKKNKEIINYLSEHKLDTINLKGIIENNNPDIYINEEMTGVWVKDGYFNFVHTLDESFLEEVVEELKINAFTGFSGSQKFIRDYMYENEVIHWSNPCHLLTLENPPYDQSNLIDEIDSLKIEDAEIVNKYYEYKSDVSLDKIKDAIINRPSSCVRIDGIPVSFALLHEDNSIGYMYTLEEYRRKGYAYEVTKDISLKTIKSGRLPYIHIAHGNDSSLKLALKSGYKIQGDVYWFGIFNATGKELKDDYKKYHDLYSIYPTHLTSTISLGLDLDILDVTFEDNKDHIIASYNNETYRIDYYYEYEMYFMNMREEIPIDILRSILVKFSKDDYIYLLNLDKDYTGFGKINIHEEVTK